ncbi:hypothetical protein C7I85_26225 [Mesorhizobium soli]|uniref:Uncharacterized protein n=1 Tax=Pseudaminobacter soli (ex Li et al. 2025) TaxID=1295366 RepID=A0A2P7RZX1_9HYPH|nr:hypothetical protein C7I85_26225 [Mesorhizobium soli]
MSKDDLGIVVSAICGASGAGRAPGLSVEHQVMIELGRLLMRAITKQFGDKIYQPDIIPSLTAYFEHQARPTR